MTLFNMVALIIEYSLIVYSIINDGSIVNTKFHDIWFYVVCKHFPSISGTSNQSMYY